MVYPFVYLYVEHDEKGNLVSWYSGKSSLRSYLRGYNDLKLSSAPLTKVLSIYTYILGQWYIYIYIYVKTYYKVRRVEQSKEME